MKLAMAIGAIELVAVVKWVPDSAYYLIAYFAILMIAEGVRIHKARVALRIESARYLTIYEAYGRLCEEIRKRHSTDSVSCKSELDNLYNKYKTDLDHFQALNRTLIEYE